MKHQFFRNFALSVLVLAACSGPNGGDQSAKTPPMPDVAADTEPSIAPTAPPSTDIYVADLDISTGTPIIGSPRPLVTNPGYDNQPSFLPGQDSLLYTSEGRSGKTDLWQTNPYTGETIRHTDTPDRSEYSPRLTPNGNAISFIQENPEGDITEVHMQPLDGGAQAAVISLKPLGYYAFLDQGAEVLVFLRSEPPTLQHVDLASGEVTEVATHIGRALYAPNNSDTAFFTIASAEEPDQAQTFTINRYTPSTGATKPLFDLPETSQDYAVFAMTDSGRYGFLSGAGGRLYFRTDQDANDWEVVADMTDEGLIDLTRLAVNDTLTTIALVTTAN